MKNGRGKKVFVGISGGVDSSVAAHLLQKEGYDVHGIFVKTWSPEWLPCTWVDEKRDAMRVCAHLGIPFHYLDASEVYKRDVADYMIAEYRAGRTPNPDVLCNRAIKFGAMWEYAQAHGADYIATGHYAQTDGATVQQAVDTAKDQSYFLWMLTPEDLAHTLFPVGHLSKDEVRRIATRAGLFTGTKKDSQGICFLGDVDMRDFLSHYIEQKPGPVVDEQGNTIGEHDGVWFYTLGERHGFRLTNHTTDQKPYYVVQKNVGTNTLVVSHTRTAPSQTHLISQTITLRGAHWLTGDTTGLTAQIRYHGTQLPLTKKDERTVVLETTEPIALGQSLVVYRNGTLIGGGIIEAVA